MCIRDSAKGCVLTACQYTFVPFPATKASHATANHTASKCIIIAVGDAHMIGLRMTYSLCYSKFTAVCAYPLVDILMQPADIKCKWKSPPNRPRSKCLDETRSNSDLPRTCWCMELCCVSMSFCRDATDPADYVHDNEDDDIAQFEVEPFHRACRTLMGYTILT